MPSVDIAAQIGTYLFLGGAVITALAMTLPHPETVDTAGYWGLCAFMLLAAGIVWLRRGAGSEGWIPRVIVAASIGVVTGVVYFNGERVGGPALVNELYYVWPALYVGYFFRPPGILIALALIAIAYGWTLNALGVGMEASIVRFGNTVFVAAGAAGAVYALRRYVDTLVDRLRAVARTDALTGVLNRRGFDERFELELRRARRTGEPLSLVIGDLDRFKRLNDERGHQAGDEALRRVAEILYGCSRDVDEVGRPGGEEFAVLMPSTPAAGAHGAAERMRAAVEAAGDGVTISFGVAELNGRDETAEELTARADAALYDAKAGGRNQTVAAGADVERSRAGQI